MSNNGNIPPVLDATCGGRMIWFDKNNPLTIFVDKRVMIDEIIYQSADEKITRKHTINPDVVADFTDLPFADNTFYHVVFDPPHLKTLGENSWMCKKYGKLPNNWREVIKDGFNECMRVLRPFGTLVFKWNETEISTKELIETIECKPLYGCRSGKASKTHWMVFIKETKKNNIKGE